MKLISNSVITFGNCTCTQVSAPDEEKPPSFKEIWLPRIKYYAYVLFVFCIWLFIIGCVYLTLDQASQYIKFVEDVP